MTSPRPSLSLNSSLVLVLLTLVATACSSSGGSGNESGTAACSGPNARFTVISPGDGMNDAGLVKDNTTGITWTRYSLYSTSINSPTTAAAFCAGRNMVLPTKAEAVGIQGNLTCAFPMPHGAWGTWTTDDFFVYANGEAIDGGAPDDGTTMCIQP